MASEEYSVPLGTDHTAAGTEHVAMARVTLSAPQITAPGYTFLAALTREEAGMVVRTAPGQSLDGWTRPDEHWCDYCRKSRARSTSYVVRNEETGEIVQIGKSCLVPFLGVSPAGLWALQYDPEDLVPAEPSGGPGSAQLFGVRELLALAWVITDEGRRYLSRAVAADRDELPTSAHELLDVAGEPVDSAGAGQATVGLPDPGASRAAYRDPCPRPPTTSAPPVRVQPVVTDAEVVGDLVDHRHRDLVHDLLAGAAHRQNGVAVDGDGVGQEAAVLVVAHRQRHPVIEAEDRRFFLVVRLHQDHHVRHIVGQLGGDGVQRVGHQPVELVVGHAYGHRVTRPGPALRPDSVRYPAAAEPGWAAPDPVAPAVVAPAVCR